MRKIISVICVAILIIGIVVAARVHHRPYHFRTPTDAQLAQAFPGQSRQILEHSQQFIFYSLDPAFVPQEKETFCGWGVIGKTVITDPKTKHLLIGSLYDSIARGGIMMVCFNPRHAIHAVRNGKSVDIIPCYHCGQVEVYSAGKEGTAALPHEAPPAFDQVLEQAGVPLGER